MALISSTAAAGAEPLQVTCVSRTTSGHQKIAELVDFELRFHDPAHFQASFVHQQSAHHKIIFSKELWIAPSEVKNFDCSLRSTKRGLELHCLGGNPRYPSYLTLQRLNSRTVRLEMQTIYGSTVRTFANEDCRFR